jgi:hypothetical protein
MGLASSGACARLASAATLVIAAALLSGCGGGGEGANSTATSSTSSPRPTTTNPSGEANSQQPSSSKQPKPQKPPPDLPPPTPGSKTAAPGVPTSKQGDNSIQTWGLEASDAEREEATATVQRYLDARAAGNWSTVCQLLAAKPRREQEQFGGGASCAKAMASFAADASPATLREEAEIEVLSFRVGDKYTFLIYRRPDGIFATVLTREAGAWKLISVTPNPIE